MKRTLSLQQRLMNSQPQQQSLLQSRAALPNAGGTDGA